MSSITRLTEPERDEVAIRFGTRLNADDETGCHLYTGATNYGGYLLRGSQIRDMER